MSRPGRESEFCDPRGRRRGFGPRGASPDRCGRPVAGWRLDHRRRAGRGQAELTVAAAGGRAKRFRVQEEGFGRMERVRNLLFAVLAHRTEDSLESREAEGRVAQTSGVRQGKLNRLELFLIQGRVVSALPRRTVAGGDILNLFFHWLCMFRARAAFGAAPVPACDGVRTILSCAAAGGRVVRAGAPHVTAAPVRPRLRPGSRSRPCRMSAAHSTPPAQGGAICC